MGDSKVSVLGAYVAVSMAVFGGQAFAHGASHHHSAGSSASGRSSHHHNGLSSRVSYHRGRSRGHGGVRYAYGAHVIQCVAFAKEDAGIVISGNARDWWGRAEGIYERGSRPEEGSVLSFRANGRMPLGHVAVVSGIEDSRTIVIDQAHWMGRGITRDMEVKDVSQNNDWSAVRVQLGHGGAFGSIYPTHGFIYPRPRSRHPGGKQYPRSGTYPRPRPRRSAPAHAARRPDCDGSGGSAGPRQTARSHPRWNLVRRPESRPALGRDRPPE